MTKILRLVTSLVILLVALCAGCNSGITGMNREPVISEMTAGNESVNPGGSSQISCVAHDADRDELTYTWEASGGTISGDGATVTWTAPQTSSAYTIRVTVSDGKGGEASREVAVDVLVQGNTAPYIKEVTTDPPPPQFWDDDIITLTCVAIDPDAGDVIVSYHWAVVAALPDKYPDPGTIVGDGAVATWTAPDVPNKDSFTVSVYCVDSRGNKSRTKFLPYEVWCACIRDSGGGQ